MNRDQAQLDALLRSAIDGDLSEADAAALADLLRNDDAALARYLTMMETDALLAEELASETADVLPAEPSPIPHPAAATRVWAVAAAVLIGAAVVGSVATMLMDRPIDEPARPVVAVMLEERSAVWQTGEPVGSGGDVTDAWRSLSSGRIEMQTRAGVNVKIAGPARFVPVSPMLTRLDEGRMVADVPRGAVGYTVRVPGGLEIVDLGTTFAVDVGEDGKTYVHVYDGTVALNLNGQAETIQAGAAVVFDPSTGRIVEGAIRRERFAELHPYELELVNGDFAAGDLTGWRAVAKLENTDARSVIVATDATPTSPINIPPDGGTGPHALRLGYKYLPVSLQQTTNHAVRPDASYTIAVRARAFDVDGATRFRQRFQIIGHVDGVNVSTEDFVADGQWRWHLAHVDAEALTRFVGEPIEIRIYKPDNKEGDFVWIDAVQLWRGEVDPEQIEAVETNHNEGVVK